MAQTARVIENFFFHPLIYRYNFGPQHPLKPERLRRMFALLDRYASDYVIESPLATRDELLTVHSAEYVEAVEAVDRAATESRLGEDAMLELRSQHGFWGDNPPFAGMWESSLASAGASVSAAKAVRDGSKLAFAIGGGWHHALSSKASGFCIFDDPAIACAILLERFPRVAYVDIDVHHGDGVQWIWYDDPRVLTCSIHESGRTLWPGTGGMDETGTEFTSLNVPVEAGTTGDVWLNLFERTVIPALEAWRPDAIVLQMGADTHDLDPLAHIRSDQGSWLKAIKLVHELGLPLVALGGGGYEMTTVPRMWASAILTLSGIPYQDLIPSSVAPIVGADHFSDPRESIAHDAGRDHAEHVIEMLQRHHIPHLRLQC